MAKYWYELYVRHTPGGEQLIDSDVPPHDALIDPHAQLVALIGSLPTIVIEFKLVVSIIFQEQPIASDAGPPTATPVVVTTAPPPPYQVRFNLYFLLLDSICFLIFLARRTSRWHVRESLQFRASPSCGSASRLC